MNTPYYICFIRLIIKIMSNLKISRGEPLEAVSSLERKKQQSAWLIYGQRGKHTGRASRRLIYERLAQGVYGDIPFYRNMAK